MPHLLDATMFWSPTSGGVRRYLTAKHEWLSERTSWRHTIVAPGVSGEGARSVRGWAIPLSGGYRAPYSRRHGAEVIIRQRPDLIEAGDPFRLAWSAIDAARHLRVPLVGFFHFNMVAAARQWTGRFGAQLARQYLRHLYRHFDLLLVPNLGLRQQLEDWGIDRVERQPLGVDAETFTPAHKDPAWRASLGLRPDQRILLFTGRFAPEKNLEVLSQAVDRLGEPYVLVVMGAGPVQPKGRRVMVLPFTNSKAALAQALASADLFVHAGDQETFGLAALEAMACGTPVVARNAAGMGELINDRVGVRVERGTPEAFAEAIEFAFARGLQQPGEAARELAQVYSWPQVMARMLVRYQQLMEAR